ncbi:MAG: hypothetical protein QME81_18380 [bacterium]|nr:hypothetical protein [bacterium]
MINLQLLEVSQKGRLVIPGKILKRLKLTRGTKMILLEEDDGLLLKKVENSPLEEFESLTAEGREFARFKGLKPTDIPKLINRVRQRKK